MPRQQKPPAYRKRTLPQGDRAYLTLRDSRTRRSKDYNLGEYGTPASRELYHRLIAAWEARGRSLFDESRMPGVSGPTVTELCYAYWRSIQGQYSPSHLRNIMLAIRILRSLYGTKPAVQFGPRDLRLIRDSMLQGDPTAKRPRRPWSRTIANRFARSLIVIFRFGVAEELIPPSVTQALRELQPIRRGQTDAREPQPVRPVPDVLVDAVLPHLGSQVRAMIELQRATGMRPGEVCAMRTRDIDVSGRVWTYTPAEHKTAHHGHVRTVYIGPRGQKVLRPWLRTGLDEYLFQPIEAEAERRREQHARRVTPAGQGNEPGTNRQAEPKRTPRDRYTTDSYRRAIHRACDKAEVERWHPHQLRHSYATAVRREHGLEAAQILLGHSSALVTDAVYAERDAAKAASIAAKMG